MCSSKHLDQTSTEPGSEQIRPVNSTLGFRVSSFNGKNIVEKCMKCLNCPIKPRKHFTDETTVWPCQF